MSISVTISSAYKLNKAKSLLGTKTESETVELALEKVIEELEQKQTINELPDNFFEDLFAEETNTKESESIKTVIKEREEREF